MKKISHRLNTFPEYAFSKIQKEIIALEQKTGMPVLNFGQGSPDVPPSVEYTRTLQEHLNDKDAHLYPKFGGIPAFTDALITRYREQYGVHLDTHEVHPLLGAKDGVSHINMVLSDEGDEVLIPDPGYPNYAGSALLFGARPVYYPLDTEREYTLSVEALERCITNKTAFIWINFPSNPTGAVITHAQLVELVACAKKHNVWILYDNAYGDITFDNTTPLSILQIDGAKEVAVEIGSLSKSFSFAGHRIGYMVGNAEVIAAFAKMKTQIDSGMFTPLQRLAAYALTHPDTAWHRNMIETYTHRRNVIARHLTTLGLTYTLPKAGLYIWARIPESCPDAETFSRELLEKRHIFVTPGTIFGPSGSRYVRVSICANTEHIESYFR